MEQRILPVEAHVIAGQLEDTLTIWRARRPGQHRPEIRAANVEATRLCGAMIAVFGGLRDHLTAELGRYDDERRKET